MNETVRKNVVFRLVKAHNKHFVFKFPPKKIFYHSQKESKLSVRNEWRNGLRIDHKQKVVVNGKGEKGSLLLVEFLGPRFLWFALKPLLMWVFSFNCKLADE